METKQTDIKKHDLRKTKNKDVNIEKAHRVSNTDNTHQEQ